MKVVFDNLANFLSISPNQTPDFAVCLPGPSWTFLLFLFLLILYSLPYMYTLYNVHVLTPTCTVQYVISWAVNIRLQLYTCFLTMRSKHASSKILNDIGRNSLLGNRKKIAKFLMRTFTCRSTFLYGPSPSHIVEPLRPYTVKKGKRFPVPSRDVAKQALPGQE